MLLFINIFLILYGLIAIGTGVHAMTGPYDSLCLESIGSGAVPIFDDHLIYWRDRQSCCSH